jgi:hypothetical protein
MPTILTIEQNDNVRHLIREVLQRAGYRVVEAATIREVAEHLVLEEPAVIIRGAGSRTRPAARDSRHAAHPRHPRGGHHRRARSGY